MFPHVPGSLPCRPLSRPRERQSPFCPKPAFPLFSKGRVPPFPFPLQRIPPTPLSKTEVFFLPPRRAPPFSQPTTAIFFLSPRFLASFPARKGPRPCFLASSGVSFLPLTVFFSFLLSVVSDGPERPCSPTPAASSP